MIRYLSYLFLVLIHCEAVFAKVPASVNGEEFTDKCIDIPSRAHLDGYYKIHDEALRGKNYSRDMESYKALTALDCIVTYAFSNEENYRTIMGDITKDLKKAESETSHLTVVAQHDASMRRNIAIHRLILELNEVWFEENNLKRYFMGQEDSNSKIMKSIVVVMGGVIFGITRGRLNPRVLIKTLRPIANAVMRLFTRQGAPRVIAAILPRAGAGGTGVTEGAMEVSSQTKEEGPEELLKEKVWASPILMSGLADHTANETQDYNNYSFERNILSISVGLAASVPVQIYAGKKFGAIKVIKALGDGMAARMPFGTGILFGPQVLLAIGVGAIVTHVVMNNMIDHIDSKTFQNFNDALVTLERDIRASTSPEKSFDLAFQYRMATEDMFKYKIGELQNELTTFEEDFKAEYICRGFKKQLPFYQELESNNITIASSSHFGDNVTKNKNIVESYKSGKLYQENALKRMKYKLGELLKKYKNEFDDGIGILERAIETLSNRPRVKGEESFKYQIRTLKRIKELTEIKFSKDIIAEDLENSIKLEYFHLMKNKESRALIDC